MTGASAAPRPSATVVLLRDGAAGPETLLVRRNARTAFGASYVFPGGTLDPDDAQVARFCGDFASSADATLSVDSGGLAYYSAAIRELFEETGVLLARPSAGDCLPMGQDYDESRAALHAGRLGWADFLSTNDLLLCCDALHYFAFWVTPRARGRRFSTRFFAAELPAGQTARHDGVELTDSRWLTAPEALTEARAGKLALPPPTRITLKALAPFASVAGIMDWTAAERRTGVSCLLPAIVADGGRERIIMPGDADYPADHRGRQA